MRKNLLTVDTGKIKKKFSLLPDLIQCYQIVSETDCNWYLNDTFRRSQYIRKHFVNKYGNKQMKKYKSNVNVYSYISTTMTVTKEKFRGYNYSFQETFC